MTKNNKQSKKFIFGIFSVMALCLCFMFGVFIGASPVYAYTEKNTSWSNLNFSSNSNVTSVYANPTGWTKGFPDSPATSGAINLTSYNNDNFNLDSGDLPAKLSDDADDHVLMINSKNSTNKNGLIPAVQYYTNSSSLSLSAYSNYKIVVWTKVLSGAQASIYITGLEETLGFERIDYSNASEWTAYTFYITTGKSTESVKTELWLGSKPENTSIGAVFFDNIEVFQISNNETPASETNNDKLVATPANSGDKVKYINLDERELIPGINADFESTDLSTWTRTVSQLKEGTNYEVLNLTSQNVSTGKNIEHLGLDLTKNNKSALVLYTEEDVKSYFGLRSPSINLPIYETLKVSVNVKVGTNNTGSAYIKFVENDVVDYNGDVIEAITPTTEQLSISSNTTNKYLNNYNTYTFYIKGRSLYNTSFAIELWLGQESSEASGVVAFDNLTIEYLSYSEYSNASTGSSSTKVDLQSTTNTYGITNSTFNTTQKAEAELTYPLIPSSWTHNFENETDIYYGVINTNEEIYNAHKVEFGNFANPGNPDGFGSTQTDTNNILMMYNFNDTYQSITSSSFSVDTKSYYKLAFAYKLIATTSNKEILNVYVVDNNDNVVYMDENISANTTNTNWSNYNVYISTNSYSNSLKLVVSLGTEDNNVKGIVYLDNVTAVKDSNLTAEDYAELTQTENVLDFDEGNFNLVENNGNSIYTALRYTGSLESGENSNVARAGIINADDTTDEFDIEISPENTNDLKYIMMIQSFDTSTYSMTAIDTLDLNADTYYKFTIWAKTIFAGESDLSYGAQFGLDGLEEKITGIVANEWTKYTIYVSCTTSTTVNLRFALVSADTNTIGMVYFDNFKYETVDSDEFNVNQLNYKDDATYLFIGDTDIDENDLVDNDTQTSNNSVALWYAIPTILLAVALIVALAAYFMKKVKVTKWEKKKVNQYDRETTVHRDVIRTEAEQLRNQRVKDVKAQISEYEQELAKLEEVHQEQLKEKRANREKGVSASDEREFKQYAKRHTAIENRIANLAKEIDNMNTAEYLLTVQHQLAVDKAKQERIAKEKAYKNNKNKK